MSTKATRRVKAYNLKPGDVFAGGTCGDGSKVLTVAADAMSGCVWVEYRKPDGDRAAGTFNKGAYATVER